MTCNIRDRDAKFNLQKENKMKKKITYCHTTYIILKSQDIFDRSCNAISEEASHLQLEP